MPHKHHHGHGNHGSKPTPPTTTELTVRSDLGHKKHHNGIGSVLAKVAHGIADHASHHHNHHHHHAPAPRPAPLPINPPRQPTPDYNARFADHKSSGDRRFRLRLYDSAITEYDLAIKCYAQSKQIGLGAAFLYALVGLDRLLKEPEIEGLYIRIAECYMLQQKYDLAIQYLTPINSRPAASAMIASCKQQIRDQAAVIEPPPQPKQPWWVLHRHEFVAEAQRLLAFNVARESQEITNYKTFAAQLQRCIATYDNKKHEPLPEECELRQRLVESQKCVSSVLVQIQAEEEQRLFHESQQRNRERARVSEPHVITALHQAQQHLAINDFGKALSNLQTARDAATGSHAMYFTNPLLQNLQNANRSISMLNSIAEHLESTRMSKARELAEAVVAQALPPDKRLFYVHKNRIINIMTEKFSRDMHKFYGKSIDQLRNEEFFKNMSALIAKDCVKIDTNKKYWRGGLADNRHLEHSHEIGAVLEYMIEQAPMSVYDLRLDIFALTGTTIDIPSAPRMPASINWYDTLCAWPNVIHNTTNLDAGIAFASVVEEEIKPVLDEKPRLAHVA